MFKWIRKQMDDHDQNNDHNEVIPYVVDVGFAFIVSVMDLLLVSNVNESLKVLN